MKFLNKMERKFGRYAIKNLMYYIIGLYILGFVIDLFAPEVYAQYLAMDSAAILRGQVWRIITFIISPPNASPIFIIFVLYLYYWIGTSLERVWERLNSMYIFSWVYCYMLLGRFSSILYSEFLYHEYILS
jgi:hypothetical protein